MKFPIFLFSAFASIFVTLLTFTYYTKAANFNLKIIPTPSIVITPTPILPTNSPIPTTPIAFSTPIPYLPPSTPSPAPTVKVINTRRPVSPTPSISTESWGVAQQISEHTWTMKIGQDPTMATPSEIHSALNEYRRIHGVSVLSWDDKLATYAQSRADFFNSQNALDSHQGFNDYLDKEDGFHKLGFNALGENASIGYRLTGVHLIEWIYAGDKPHDDNQLDSRWAYVGIGVRGTATCLIFATGRI